MVSTRKSLSPFAFGLSLGIVYGLFFILTAWATWLWGYAQGMTTLHSGLYYGISPSFLGGLIAFFWGLLIGFIAAFSWGYVYQLIAHRKKHEFIDNDKEQNMLSNYNAKYLSSNAFGSALGIVYGTFLGVLCWGDWLFGYGHGSVIKNSQVFPGMDGTFIGGLIGFFWGFVAGYLFGGVWGLLYNLIIKCFSFKSPKI